ncbi:hypothetical protein QO200_10735 [Flavobacterium sp. Arc3]|jgi:glucosylceramidase|uniref:hypothetical protein n=1 Tax=Flavobacterium sp. Arc3 TaxID=3046686 RepID=UPI00352CDDEC
MSFHCYEHWNDGIPMFDAVKNVKETYPDKNLIFTEECNEAYNLERLNREYPTLAERYGRSMTNYFNNGTVAWSGWNILLDQIAGTKHVGNLCFSPVHGNTQTGELTFTNS